MSSSVCVPVPGLLAACVFTGALVAGAFGVTGLGGALLVGAGVVACADTAALLTIAAHTTLANRLTRCIRRFLTECEPERHDVSQAIRTNDFSQFSLAIQYAYHHDGCRALRRRFSHRTRLPEPIRNCGRTAGERTVRS